MTSRSGPPEQARVDLSRSTLPGKALRYALVSGAAGGFGIPVFLLLKGGMGWSGGPATFVSLTVGSVPNYLWTRGWVWQKRDRHRFLAEILPFWLLTIPSLVASSGAAAIADAIWGGTFVVLLAAMGGLGAVWIVRFVVLDRYLFRAPPVVADDGVGATPSVPPD